MENNNDQEEKKKKGIFKLYRVRIAALATAITVGLSSIGILNYINRDKGDENVPNDPDASITDFDPNHDHNHDHEHSEGPIYNPDDNTVIVPTPGSSEEPGIEDPATENNTEMPSHTENPGSTETPGEEVKPGEETEKPGTTPGPIEQHIHTYSQVTRRFVDNGDGTHTLELVGTCPTDGATLVLLKGRPQAHTLQNVYDKDGNVIGEECSAGCGYQIVKEHGHRYEVSSYYEELDANTHRLVTVKTCIEPDCPEDERVIKEYGMPMNHRYLPGITDPKTGETIYVCKDCEFKKVVQKEKPDVHIHDYSIQDTKYVDNGDGTHTAVTTGVCPVDGATKVLKKGHPEKHTVRDILDEQGNVIGEECTAPGCGYKKTFTIEHGHRYETTSYYENMGDKGHRLVTVKTCTEPGCPEDEREIVTYGPIVKHTLETVKDAQGNVIGERCTTDGCGYYKVLKHEHNYQSTSHYEDLKNGTHRKVTDTKCVAPGCPDAGKVNTTYGQPESHTIVPLKDNKGNVIGEKCSHCSYQKVFDPPVHEHKYTEEVPGTASYESIDDDNHKKTVTMRCPADGATKPVTTTVAHNYDAGVTQTNGDIHFTCSDCHHVKVQKYVPPEHQHNYETKTHYEDLENGTHRLVTVKTCTAPGCLETERVITIYGEPVPHHFGETQYLLEGHVQTCECGKTKTADHTWDNGTEEDGVIVYHCTVSGCPGYKEEQKHVHAWEEPGTIDYTSNESTHTKIVTKKCTGCEEKNVTTTTSEHHFGETQYLLEGHVQTCECGKTKTADHTWDNGTEEDGVMVYHCTVSGCPGYKEEQITKTAASASNLVTGEVTVIPVEQQSQDKPVLDESLVEGAPAPQPSGSTEQTAETELQTATLQVTIPAGISSTGDTETVEVKVPADKAEEAMDAIKSQISDALEGQEATYEESSEMGGDSYEEDVDEDDKVLTLDNNKNYY